MVGEIVGAATFLVNLVLVEMSNGLSDNMIKGLNALRCILVSGPSSVKYLGVALAFAAKQFGLDATVQDYVNQGYPYLCTCQQDVENIGETFS